MFGGTSAFGNTAPTFGTTSFTGANTANPFGATAQTGTTSLFGGTTGFNTTKPAGFGTPFGSPQQQSTSIFGQQNRLGGNTTMFGNATNVASPFGAPLTQQQGTAVQFSAITGSDTMMKNGVASPINTRHQCITCMKEYEQKSLEELRFEDYQIGRKGPVQQNTVFGNTQAQPTGLFSSIAPAASTANAFGQQRPATFGTMAPQPTSTGLFSNINQPKPSFFGTTPATNTFGAPTTGFTGFAAPQPQQQTSIFGQTNPVTSTMGSTTGFTFTQPTQQQPQQLGLGFGQKPMMAPGATSAPFGFGTQTQTMSKPNTLFNTTAPTFSSAFGAAPVTSANIFNTPVSKPFSFTGAPASTAPSFSFATPSIPAFGTGTSGFGAQTTTTPSTGFSAFGSAPLTTSNTGGFTGFGNTTFGAPVSTGFSFNTGNTFAQPNQFQQAQAPSTGPVPFATSPYKDSPLFYNLVTNRNLDNMTKPTNPLAQRAMKEASRRRSSTAVGSVGQTMSLKQMTFPVNKSSSQHKQSSLFDGFEEEDHGPIVDILSPKTSVKKLSLKTVRGMNRLSLPLTTSRSPNDTVQLGSVSLDLNSQLDSTMSEVNRSSEDENGNEREVDDDLNCNFVRPSSRAFNPVAYTDPNAEIPSTGDEDGYRCGVICTVPGYYIQPSLHELDMLTDDDGRCFVQGFCVGRHNYGFVKFLQSVDVAGLNIDEIVKFRHKEVVVYPEELESPPVGQGLNVPADVHLMRVWPFNKKTRENIKDLETIRALKYEDLLRRSCERMDVEFMSYDPEEGVWVFRTKHFSKYSCTPEEEDEEEELNPPAAKIPAKGLGGMTPAQIKLNCPQIPFGANGNHEEDPIVILEHNNNTPYKKFQGLEEMLQLPTKPLDISVEHTRNVVLGSIFFPDDDQGRTDRRLVTMDLEDITSGYDTYVEKSVLRERPERDIDVQDKEETQSLSSEFRELALKVPTIVTDSKDTGILSKKKHLTIWNRKREEVQRKAVAKPFELFKRISSDTFSMDLPPRSARVCMGSKGRFIQILNNHLPSPLLLFNGQIGLNILANDMKYNDTNLITSFKQVLIHQLEMYVEHSMVSNDTYMISGRDIIGAHVKNLEVFTGPGSFLEPGSLLRKNLKDEREVWKLVEILTGNGNAFLGCPDQEVELVQRKQLVKWLRENGNMLFTTLYKPSDTSVKGYMMRGLKQEASRQAIRDKNYTLALAIAQNGLLAKLQWRSQLSYWEQQGALPFIDADLLEMYGLCGGFPVWGDMDLTQVSTSEWLQHFATFVWYLSPPYYTIDEVVCNFQSTLKQSVDETSDDFAAPAPATTDSSLANLCIHLLKKYSTVGYPINKLLSPKSHTTDVLDYKVSWFLLQAFLKVGVQVEEELIESITAGFASQLEMMSMFEWAVYVLKFLPKTEVRQVAIQRLLERHVTPAFHTLTSEQFQKKIMILEEFGVTYDDLKECKFARKKSADQVA